MNTIQVEIISPTEAKELNKYEKPIEPLNEQNCEQYSLWQLEQYNRRVFKIVKSFIVRNYELGGDNKWELPEYEIGSIHTAEIDNENLTCVIK